MVNRAARFRTSAAAPAATDGADRYAAVLSELTELAMELARAFQAQAVKALQDGDLDRAVVAEASFNRSALTVRRAAALDAKLHRQREAVRHQADVRRQRRQEETDGRRRALAQGLSRAIAVVAPEHHERLTDTLWAHLTEDERTDADLADTALPIETLMLRLGRDIGLAGSAIAYGLDPDKVRTVWSSRPAEPPEEEEEEEEEPVTGSAYYGCLSAADLGLPGDGRYTVRVDTGEVFDHDGNVIMRLVVSDNPRRDGVAGLLPIRIAPAEGAVPPEPDPPPPESDADRRRREYDELVRAYGMTPYPRE